MSRASKQAHSGRLPFCAARTGAPATAESLAVSMHLASLTAPPTNFSRSTSPRSNVRFGRPMASPLFVPCRRPCSIPVIARPRSHSGPGDRAHAACASRLAGARPSAVAHSPRPGSVHHGADVGLGRGGGDGATGVQDEATRVAEHGDELTRFRFDERGRAERDDGAGVEVADKDGGVLHEVVGEADGGLVVEVQGGGGAGVPSATTALGSRLPIKTVESFMRSWARRTSVL